MSVAHNLWHPADNPHIFVSTSPDLETAQLLVKCCPAGLFSLTAAGELRVDYQGCLECGTCRLLSDRATLEEWRYPASGFGITFRFG